MSVRTYVRTYMRTYVPKCLHISSSVTSRASEGPPVRGGILDPPSDKRNKSFFNRNFTELGSLSRIGWDALGSRREGFVMELDVFKPSRPCRVFINKPMTVFEPQECLPCSVLLSIAVVCERERERSGGKGREKE